MFRKRGSQLRGDPPCRAQLSRHVAVTVPYPHRWEEKSQLAPSPLSSSGPDPGLLATLPTTSWRLYTNDSFSASYFSLKSQLSCATCPWLTTAPLPQGNKHSEDSWLPTTPPRESHYFYDEAAQKHAHSLPFAVLWATEPLFLSINTKTEGNLCCCNYAGQNESQLRHAKYWRAKELITQCFKEWELA